MVLKEFECYEPTSLSEAVQLLKENKSAKVLAGGQSLLPLMKLRLIAPTALVAITKLRNLSHIKEESNYLAIGALTTHDTIEKDEIVKERFPLLADAAGKIGDQHIRNAGTIGGSTCHADPAADFPTVLLALDAEFLVSGGKGNRVIPASEFFKDFFTTALGQDEILTEIKLPYLPPRSGSVYIKHSMREGDFAMVSVGTVVTVDEKRHCKDARIALGGVGPTPIRAKAAEKYLRGRTLNEESITGAAERSNKEANPPSDMQGPREYRMEMIKVFTRRALTQALSRVK